MALLGNRMAQIRLRIFAIWLGSSFFAYHLRWVYIPKTHTGLQKIQKKYPATSCGGVLLSRTLKKFLHVPAEDRTRDPSIYSLALYHVAIKAGLYRKAVQVYYIPNLYPVTFSPSILNSSSNSQKYKNHWK